MKKIYIALFVFLFVFVLLAGCKKTGPANPPANTATRTATGTSTMISSPSDTATITPTFTDTVTATITATITDIVTATYTITATITPLETVGSEIPGADYPFTTAGEIADWTPYYGTITGKYHETLEFFDSPGSMRLGWNGSLSGYGEIVYTPASTIDLSANEISFYMKCPAEMAGYSLNLSVWTVPGNATVYLGEANGLGGWQHYTFDFNGATLSGGADASQITQLSIGIIENGGVEVNGVDIYLDSVDFDY